MSRFTPPIRRIETAKGHRYEDANGAKVPGVTTIIGNGLPKAALINWSANATAEAAVDQWDELTELSPSKRLNELKKARYADKDRAAKRGTEVHRIAEHLIKGEEVEVPDEIAGHVESYVSFLDAFGPTPVLVEAVIVSHRYGWAGTLDLIADFPTLGKRLLVDVKTNRSGVFGETALQLAGYRYADAYIDADGNEQPMIEVDGCAVVHVRGDGYDLVPVTATDVQLRGLRYVKCVAEFVDSSRDLIGNPVPPPNSAPIRRLETIQ